MPLSKKGKRIKLGLAASKLGIKVVGAAIGLDELGECFSDVLGIGEELAPLADGAMELLENCPTDDTEGTGLTELLEAAVEEEEPDLGELVSDQIEALQDVHEAFEDFREVQQTPLITTDKPNHHFHQDASQNAHVVPNSLSSSAPPATSPNHTRIPQNLIYAPVPPSLTSQQYRPSSMATVTSVTVTETITTTVCPSNHPLVPCVEAATCDMCNRSEERRVGKEC